jgi:hypothetical protein
MPSIGSECPALKINIETAKRTTETRIVMKTFNPSLTDFKEKAGFRRKRPRTKTTFAATINIINPVLISKEIVSVWDPNIEANTVIKPAIGRATSQLFINMAFTNLFSPAGAFL